MVVPATEIIDPAKLEKAMRILKDLKRVVVALSGGVDSSLLLTLAADALGRENVLAVMAISTVFPQRDSRNGREVARKAGVELVEMPTTQLTDTSFIDNSEDRCYHCKKRILQMVRKLADERDFFAIVTGANADDTSDYRPGSRAETEMNVRRPLQEAGLTKAEIRILSRQMNLKSWDAPSQACLATRIPYGEKITEEKLSRIGQAEHLLEEMGFGPLRVRDHNQIARLEIPVDQLAMAIAHREEIDRVLHELGYAYVTLDLRGFRSGSMNETLKKG